jgi:predicted transcriptional regulator
MVSSRSFAGLGADWTVVPHGQKSRSHVRIGLQAPSAFFDGRDMPLTAKTRTG